LSTVAAAAPPPSVDAAATATAVAPSPSVDAAAFVTPAVPPPNPPPVNPADVCLARRPTAFAADDRVKLGIFLTFMCFHNDVVIFLFLIVESSRHERIVEYFFLLQYPYCVWT
jgi:hypothetical protein